jgi:hypothetical protein
MTKIKFHEKFDIAMFLAMCEWSSEGDEERKLKYGL